MSLILEALKKVERERATPEQRGFLVLAPAAWAPSRSNLAWVLGMIAAAAVAGGAVYVLTRPPASGASAPVAEERSVPVAAPPLDAVRGGGLADSVPGPPTDSTPRRMRPAAVPAPATPAPGPAAAADEPVLLLHAISEQDGTPVAVVNQRVVREGDSFDGVRVLRIGAAEVEVEVKGARRILRF